MEDPHGRAAENTANTEETGAAEGGMTDTGETTSTTAAETVAPDEPDVDDWTLVRYIRRLTMEADRFLQALSDLHGLHRTDLAALSAIMDAADEGRLLSQGDLAATLNLSASATTSVLDRLQTAGYIERRRDTADRRKLVLHLHESALALGNELFTPLGEAYFTVWREFDREQRRTIVRFLAATLAATARTSAALPRKG